MTTFGNVLASMTASCSITPFNASRYAVTAYVSSAVNECGVTYCAEALLDYQRTGEMRPPMANRDPLVAPQGVYRCIGDGALQVQHIAGAVGVVAVAQHDHEQV